MRDTNLCPQVFCEDLERLLARDASSFSTECVSRIAPSDRISSFENTFRIKTRNLNELIALAVFSWYCEEGVGILVRENLREIYQQNEENYFVLGFLIERKAEMLIFLQETSLWHTRDFYGNILTKSFLRRVNKLCVPVFASKRRPKRVQRHRGYRDKGTLRKRHEYHSFVDDNKALLELEERKIVLADSIQIVRGFLYGGVG